MAEFSVDAPFAADYPKVRDNRYSLSRVPPYRVQSYAVSRLTAIRIITVNEPYVTETLGNFTNKVQRRTEISAKNLVAENYSKYSRNRIFLSLSSELGRV